MNNPILFDHVAVALMIRVALFFHPGFGRPHSASQLRLMAAGRMKPSPSILGRLNLEPQGKQYLWRAQ